MLLKHFHIRDFQSIRDSNPAEVGDITCLVGKNEAGKTALLKALYRLNPIAKGDDKFDVTDDYPRARVTEYEQEIRSGKRTYTVVTEATLALEDEELKPIEEHFGTGVLPGAEVMLTRTYENKTHFAVKADETIAGETLLARANLAEALKQENLAWKSLKELASVLEKLAQGQQEKFNEAYAASAIADPDEKMKAFAARIRFTRRSCARSAVWSMAKPNAGKPQRRFVVHRLY